MHSDFKKIIPFITFVVACLMNVFNFDFQEWIQFILQKVGSGVTPLVVSVGLQLRFEAEVNIGSFGAWAAV
jgi:predicted permease